MKNLSKAGWYRIVNVDESRYKLMEGTGVSDDADERSRISFRKKKAG